MHELAVCQGLMREIDRVACRHGAHAVSAVTVAIGDLSGVEPQLLAQAFTIARAGSVAGLAELRVERVAPRIACLICAAVCDAVANRLLCARCGSWRVEVVAGEEMLLKSVELVFDDDEPQTRGEDTCARHADAR
ncbi:MAG: hydrogenase maturation nickel metallochaperone HypA [Burkholderiaceae bacterium]